MNGQTVGAARPTDRFIRTEQRHRPDVAACGGSPAQPAHTKQAIAAVTTNRWCMVEARDSAVGFLESTFCVSVKNPRIMVASVDHRCSL